MDGSARMDFGTNAPQLDPMTTNAHDRRIRVSALLPKPDPRSWTAYALLAALAVGTYVSLSITGLRFSVAWGVAFSEVAVVAIFVAWMLRRAGHAAISTGLETIALGYLISLAGVAIQYPLMALPFPFTDALLSRIDHALGFDWWAFAQLFSNRWLWGAMVVAYVSIIPQTLLLRLLPADGSLTLCSLNPDSPWISNGACNYGPIIHQLKAGQIKSLGSSGLVGLVSFPSFHTSIGLQLAWGFWPYRWLRWPMLACNILLVCGAIVIASHYLIDILGGALIGLLAIPAAGILGHVNATQPRT